jgi:DNA-binding beta-propeller fold protein YncE
MGLSSPTLRRFVASHRYLTIVIGFVMLAVGATMLVFFLQVLPDLFAGVDAGDEESPDLARFEKAILIESAVMGSGAQGGESAGYRPTKGTVLDGDVLVLESGSGSILRLDAGGSLTEIELETPGPSGLQEPQFSDVEVSDTGTLLISDLANGQVWNYSLDGRYLAPLMSEEQRRAAGLGKPAAIDRDLQGRLVLADVEDHRVKVFDKTGELVSTFGGFGFTPGLFNYPTDVVVDSDGRLFVADSENGRVQVFTPQGDFMFAISATDSERGLTLPRTLAFDDDARLHVVDPFAGRVWVFTAADGEYLGDYPVVAPAEQQVSLPEAIAIAGDTIVLGDRGNMRLAVYRY